MPLHPTCLTQLSCFGRKQPSDLFLIFLHIFNSFSIELSQLLISLIYCYFLSKLSKSPRHDIVFFDCHFVLLLEVIDFLLLFNALLVPLGKGLSKKFELVRLLILLLIKPFLQVHHYFVSGSCLLKIFFQPGVDLLRMPQLLGKIHNLIVNIFQLFLESLMPDVSLLYLINHVHIFLSYLFNLSLFLENDAFVSLFHVIHLYFKHFHLVFQVFT